MRLLIILGFIVLACGSPTTNSSSGKYSVGLHRALKISIGHEDLTHYAAIDANMLLGRYLFPVHGHVLGETAGIVSENALIRGNYLTDRPLDRRDGEIDFEAIIGRDISSNFAWHDISDSYAFHFLRRIRPLQDARDACLEAQDRVVELTEMGLSVYGEDLDLAMNYFGAATHIIQDSFSKAHSVRLGGEVLDVCTFGEEYSGVCYHSMLDAASEDMIYKSRVGVPVGVERVKGNLKDDALMAVEASSEYLMVVGLGLVGDGGVDLDRVFLEYLVCKSPNNQ